MRQGLSLKAMGLGLNGLSVKKLFIGVLSGLVWLGFMLGVYIPLARYIAAGHANGYTEYNFLIGNLQVYLMTVLAAWLVGGVYEELAFRGFIRWGVTRLAGKVPGARYYSAGIASLLFGLYHIQQGWLGVIPATLGGLYWTWITVKHKGDLWPAIASHIVYDTAVLTLIYLDRSPGQH
ncbi:CPBP family intramembrane glutamic endopeptidase [Mucilaginibacter segetis]|uniref:CPBP family intramembrane metalloprotease n=1 Tax=Mucilaginibacter segetis TaxID=2793071 RepID=A0A934UMU0_9SPHI|nr:CPBP family intramembrane glutamic endopeptidase [Mucilaginibacter segetis]MBK0379221.1 CPBP family intramembrane metalloprotease [Mucilaginibacter segetis]